MMNSTKETNLKNLLSRFEELFSNDVRDIMMSGWDSIILSDGKNLYNVCGFFEDEKGYYGLIDEFLKYCNADAESKFVSASYGDKRIAISKLDNTHSLTIRKY